MAAHQLWLFPPPRPLVERLGEHFFRQIPDKPGVYYLCGRDAGVLYVGKAKNLRRRLGAYRVANPERLPRRMVRLLHQVTRIEWDVCASEAAARHREELLICVLSPRFNRAGKVWPAAAPARDGSSTTATQRCGLRSPSAASLERARPGLAVTWDAPQRRLNLPLLSAGSVG